MMGLWLSESEGYGNDNGYREYEESDGSSVNSTKKRRNLPPMRKLKDRTKRLERKMRVGQVDEGVLRLVVLMNNTTKIL
jgi:hypothetical protein